MAHVGGDAQIVAAGELKLDGQKLLCGQRPTVLDNNLDDYGAAYPGFLILNPKLLKRVSTPVKMWIYAHECGHQFRGPDEETADCFAVQRGRRQKWLTPEGLEEVCRFIAPAKGDSMHFSGSHRCEAMRKCYVGPGDQVGGGGRHGGQSLSPRRARPGDVPAAPPPPRQPGKRPALAGDRGERGWRLPAGRRQEHDVELF